MASTTEDGRTRERDRTGHTLRCVSMSRPASRYAQRDMAGHCPVLSRCPALGSRGSGPPQVPVRLLALGVLNRALGGA